MRYESDTKKIKMLVNHMLRMHQAEVIELRVNHIAFWSTLPDRKISFTIYYDTYVDGERLIDD